MRHLKRFNENTLGLTRGEIRKMVDSILDRLGAALHFYILLPDHKEEFELKIKKCLEEIKDSNIDFEKDVVKSVRERKDHLFMLLKRHNLV